MIWFMLGGILLVLLGFLVFAVLMVAGATLFLVYVVVPVLVWLDRQVDRWAFRHTHRLEITKLLDGYEIHEWRSKEHNPWDC